MTRLVYIVARALSLLPLRVLYCASDVTAPILYYIIRYRRRIVRRNLTSSFPEKPVAEIKAIEKGFYRWFCDYFIEAVKLLGMDDNELNRRLHVVNPEVHEAWFSRGRSTAVLLGHYCNWEWLSRVGKDLRPERRCCLIYDPLHSRAMDNLFLRIRSYPPTGVPTPKKDILRQLLRWRQEGVQSISGYIADQAPKWENTHLWLPFLNHPETPVFTGAERIIRKLDNAVFFVKMTRPRRGYYEVEFVPVTDKPTELPEGEITRRFFVMLEQAIKEAPQYYLWSHDRWKRTKAEFDRRFSVVNGRVVKK